MTTNERRVLTIFQILVKEFDDQPKKAKAKIKRALREHNFGEYDQAEVDRLRALMKEIEQEILLFRNSPFFIAFPGPYANLTDFDAAKMTQHYSIRYPEFAKEMGGLVGFALYAYYLR